ncbi:MAG: cell envelope integrity protein TolA [Pseudomonadota bacterium]
MQRFAIQAGLALLSLLLHIWVVGGVWAVNFTLVFLGLITPMEEREQTELIVVPIELVDLGEINNIAPVITPPEEEPEDDEVIDPEEEELPPEEEEVIPEDSVDETLPEDEIEQTNPDSAPEEAVEEDVVPDLDAEPVTETEEEDSEPEPEPEPKEEPPVQRQTRDPLAGFLDDADSTFQSERQTRKRTPEPQTRTPPKPLLEDTRPKPQTPRRGAGERTANTARLEALLYNYVKPCWNGVDDLPNPSRLNIRMRAELDDNGNIIDLRLVEPARRPIGRDPMGIAVDRGLRAVRKCAPYKLPRDDYSEWRDIRINLGPAFEPN